mmetsp:Transcript_10298/g.20656  ORF Transcript_10298/g.20656 Transcript_10298/m.20656 type:complete len:584 (+) Transcript_10298:79-1830(+)
MHKMSRSGGRTMKQRNVFTAPVAQANDIIIASKQNISRAGSKPRASSQLFSTRLVNLFIGIVLSCILCGIILLHRRLDQLEEKHSKQIIVTSNAKVDHFIATMPASNNQQIEGRGAGSGRGTVKCDADISSLVSYWDDPLSDADRSFRSPFLDNPLTTTVDKRSNTKPKRYLSFEPDLGGWNNIRMEFEIMLVFASATGRTLIMPPDTPFYLLQRDSKVRHRGFRHFFHEFDDVIDTLTTEEFYKLEVLGKNSYSLPSDEEVLSKLVTSLSKCNNRKKSETSCSVVFEHLSEIADFVPDWHGEHHCLIMDDKNWFKDAQTETTEEIKRFCGTRDPAFYNTTIHDAPLLHFRTGGLHKETRLLSQFYSFIHFTSPRVGNFYKRLIRNRCRYSDEIFCSSGKIIQALSGGNVDANSNHTLSSYSSMHIRRGDFQWKKMRITADEWFENTKDIFHPGETIYIATDETNRTFFEPLAKHYNLKFLSDFQDVAGLNQLDPNFVGMIDQVVCSRGRVFVGTYFSSFSAYIGRMRGYHGTSNKLMFYGQLDRKYETHTWSYPHSSYSAREYPTGWNGIDGDTEPSEVDFF